MEGPLLCGYVPSPRGVLLLCMPCLCAQQEVPTCPGKNAKVLRKSSPRAWREAFMAFGKTGLCWRLRAFACFFCWAERSLFNRPLLALGSKTHFAKSDRMINFDPTWLLLGLLPCWVEGSSCEVTECWLSNPPCLLLGRTEMSLLEYRSRILIFRARLASCSLVPSCRCSDPPC